MLRSAPVTRNPSSAVPIDVDLAGAHELILFVDPTGDGVTGGAALWMEPTLVFDDGRTQPLVDLAWTSADALWDSAAVRRSTVARPLTFRARPFAFAIATLGGLEDRVSAATRRRTVQGHGRD